MSLTLDQISHEQLEIDPYPIYATLRKEHPIAYIPQVGQWFVTSWEACAILGRMTGSDVLPGGHRNDYEFFGGHSILTLEGEAHDQLREGIDAQLRPREVRTFTNEVAHQVVIEYLEALRPLGRGDLVADLFEHISVRVIGNRLGLDDISDTQLIEWFQALSGGMSNLGGDDARATRAKASIAEIDEYMREKIEAVTAAPDDSLISHIVHGGVPEGQPPRTFEEVMPSLRVIILGGFQEPGNAVSNAFLGMFSNPTQLDLLRSDPEKFSTLALNESLRWIAPIGIVARHTTDELEIEGVTLPKGAQVALVVASANRDEERYEHADRFDMTREHGSHVSFGFGSHHCSGHFLAKSLGQIVIEETIQRLPNLRPDPDRAPVVEGYFFRGAKSLPALWDA